LWSSHLYLVFNFYIR